MSTQMKFVCVVLVLLGCGIVWWMAEPTGNPWTAVAATEETRPIRPPLRIQRSLIADTPDDIANEPNGSAIDSTIGFSANSTLPQSAPLSQVIQNPHVSQQNRGEGFQPTPTVTTVADIADKSHDTSRADSIVWQSTPQDTATAATKDETIQVATRVSESPNEFRPMAPVQPSGFEQSAAAAANQSVENASDFLAIEPTQAAAAPPRSLEPRQRASAKFDGEYIPPTRTESATEPPRTAVAQLPEVPRSTAPDRMSTHRSQANARNPSAIVEERAFSHIRYGQSLVRRGAFFAARHEFLEALRLVAESYDYRAGNRDRTTALAAAIRAIDESDDFQVSDNRTQLTMNVAAVLQTHDSRIIDPQQARQMSPITAMQAYYQFASDQLDQAAGKSKAASAALHELGQLNQMIAEYGRHGSPIDRAKAMVMFEASLSADPGNALSSLELARLLVQNGHDRRARELYLASLQVRNSRAAWQELAELHQRLGETDLARLALREATRDSQTTPDPNTNPQSEVRLVSATEFQQGSWPMAITEDAPLNRTADSDQSATKSPQRWHQWIKPVKDWF